MENEKQVDEMELRLYAMLVEQLHKYATIFWQFPMALIAANCFVIDKFLAQPIYMVALALLDGVFAFAFQRLVGNQRAIIITLRDVESGLIDTRFGRYIPRFEHSRVPAPKVTTWAIWGLTVGVAILAIVKISS